MGCNCEKNSKDFHTKMLEKVKVNCKKCKKEITNINYKDKGYCEDCIIEVIFVYRVMDAIKKYGKPIDVVKDRIIFKNHSITL